MRFNALALSVVAIGLSVLGWTRSAHAATCVNDNDCPGTACGSDVCSYLTATPACTAAGQARAGMDGWCATDADCKCQSLGATCMVPYCTFTTPPDASTSSGTSTSGTSTSGTSTSGTSTSGTTSTGGTSSGTASGSSTSGGTIEPTSTSGCAMSQPAGAASRWAFGLVALGTCVALARRRRA